jgi:UDP-glucuronate 4-epimerase
VTTIVTGAAGFIGFHVARRLATSGERVIGVDSVNDYYDVSLKMSRLAELNNLPSFYFRKMNLANSSELHKLFMEHEPARVIHLAAQAGVRYSLENPQAYVESNIIAFVNVLEVCRYSKVSHLTYASSSSVYGANTNMPFSVRHNVDHPLSLYAASKKSNELIAHTYSHLFDLPTTGLRFFTVYGPWGRPDMAMFLFAKAILAGQPIRLFNHGRMRRDFTYIDDIVEGVVRTSNHVATSNSAWTGARPDPGTSSAPFRLYNIGNNTPVEIEYVVSLLEERLNRTAVKEYLPMQPGDVPSTCADVDDLAKDIGFVPATSIEDGVRMFIDWFKSYHSASTR